MSCQSDIAVTQNMIDGDIETYLYVSWTYNHWIPQTGHIRNN